ncbi:MAG: DUF1489 domain-containing protein [Alphaproteobacteria bacterium]|nr:DUF1489 domain-containing protein [Alphaproteobacteria bacterium]MBU0793631.1 DUF1489 domain-containing protein [Alphaproteobacteria bacterium]MBU0877736.1 DUF1489 domain-containing protein [Alphaproteobacteria bacterium]MBU1771152.1 DUF1489 domain-containing protein [Alphaproteobacteria bacterium]
MPLHMTKIAFQSESAATLRAWLESHAQPGEDGEARLTTRYLPKRHEEMAGGSLYWILAHQIIGRSPLLGFEERPDGRQWIRLAPRLIPVIPRPKRAHQGWRYLAAEDAPADMGDGVGADVLPDQLAADLGRLGLL